MKRYLQWNKATMALAIVGSILILELVGYVLMTVLGHVVPTSYTSFMYATLTGLLAVAGAQYVNGKVSH